MRTAPPASDDSRAVQPDVSVIAAVHNASAHLREFFDSLWNQTFDHRRIELVLVDDGSTDQSLTICQAFAENWDGPVKVISKRNGGPGSARNIGMDAASGTWFSFADPDDRVDPTYFASMLEFASEPKCEDVSIVAAKLSLFSDQIEMPVDDHPLNFRFRHGNRVINLDKSPRNIHIHTASSLCRASAVRAARVRFDERLRPHFEDAAFVVALLLSQPAPKLGVVPKATYLHRKVAFKGGMSDTRRYTQRLRLGHLTMLDQAEAQLGLIPRWVQNIVLYDLLGIFKDSQTREMASLDIPEAVAKEFFQLLDQILDRLTNEAIASYDVMGGLWWYQTALLVRKRGVGAYTAPTLKPDDEARGLAGRTYLYAGAPPRERFTVGGVEVEPRYVSDRRYSVLNQPFVWERQLWLSREGELRVWFDDVEQVTYEAFRESRAEFLWYHPFVPESARKGAGGPLGPEDEFLHLRRFYEGAWVVMDRETAANDNGEIFFKWLRAEHPEIKSYFVIRDDVPDWERLTTEGYDLVAYGSIQWKALILSARHMISSQIADNVIKPLPVEEYGEREWFFTFLQHGVTKDNIFTWLNTKRLAVLVTSTEDEYNYCAGPGPSRFGNREVRLTGFPRYDDLIQKAASLPEDEVKYLLIAPTWRQYLAGKLIRGQEREINVDFMQSQYAQAWNDLLHSDSLRKHAEASGLAIAFLPHPNIQEYIEQFALPEHVEVLQHADIDFRDVLARSRMMISDYSSIAFDMAYLYRHVVYYQFDRDEFFKGDHSYTPGYYSYIDDGFGPVAEDESAVVDAVEAVLTGTIDQAYAQRMRRTFPVRDGRNCERTYRAILEAETPQSFSKASTAAPFDSWETVTQAQP